MGLFSDDHSALPFWHIIPANMGTLSLAVLGRLDWPAADFHGAVNRRHNESA